MFVQLSTLFVLLALSQWCSTAHNTWQRLSDFLKPLNKQRNNERCYKNKLLSENIQVRVCVSALLRPRESYFLPYQSSNAAKHGHIRRTMLVMGFIGYTIPSVWWRTWLVWATGRRLLSPSMKHLVQPLSAAMARCSAVEVLEISGLGISAVVVWLLLAIRAEFSHGLKSISCALFSHLLVF